MKNFYKNFAKMVILLLDFWNYGLKHVLKRFAFGCLTGCKWCGKQHKQVRHSINTVFNFKCLFAFWCLIGDRHCVVIMCITGDNEKRQTRYCACCWAVMAVNIDPNRQFVLWRFVWGVAGFMKQTRQLMRKIVFFAAVSCCQFPVIQCSCENHAAVNITGWLVYCCIW